MGGTDESGGRIQSTFGIQPKNQSEMQNLTASQMGFPMRQLPQNLSPGGSENSNKRPGIPPSYPNNPATSLQYSPVSGSRSASRLPGSQNLSPGPSHSRSLSQPTFFSLDNLLPPLSPSPYREPAMSSLSDPISTDVSMEESAVNSHAPSLLSPVNGGNAFPFSDGLPPRRGHRRSSSDNIPLGFSDMIQSSPQLIPISSRGVLDRSLPRRENLLGMEKPAQLVMKGELKRDRDGNSIADGTGEAKSEGEIVDDFFNEYMNLDIIDKVPSELPQYQVNSPGTEEKDLDSRASGSKTNGCDSSDNEVESRVNCYHNSLQGSSSSFANEKREGKRIAGGDMKPTVRHYRSVSMDSFVGDLHFDDDSLKVPPVGARAEQHSPSNTIDGNLTEFNLELRNGQFSESELGKIKENAKLAEIALADPKRAKRILANRQSAARSKERKMRYTADLEHKAQTLQTENTTLSNEVAKLQRDSVALKCENNELKFRLQAMEQESKLKDALNEALTAEVQHLRVAAAESGGEGYLADCMAQQLSINQQMFQLPHPQPTQLYQLLQQQQQQQQLQQAQLQSQQHVHTEQQNGNSAKQDDK